MSDDYYWVAKCGNCEDGLYGKSKDNTVGFKSSNEYFCKNCGINTDSGPQMRKEVGTDIIPKEYLENMSNLKDNEEYHIWLKIGSK